MNIIVNIYKCIFIKKSFYKHYYIHNHMYTNIISIFNMKNNLEIVVIVNKDATVSN